MLKLLGVYKNGNYSVKILSDGTKIRETNDDEFIPSFAENCDIKITDKCDGGCPFCYEGCTTNGRHGDILNYKFLDTLHPYTELAINGNDLSHPDLVPFMYKMREKKIILNMTVNQIHFERHFDTIKKWIEEENLAKQEAFINCWHYFLLDVQKVLDERGSDELRKKVSMYILQSFYLEPFPKNMDFFDAFEGRLASAEKLIKQL